MSYNSQDVFQYSGKPYISSIPNQNFTVQAPQLASNLPMQGYQKAQRADIGTFGQSQVNNVFRPISHSPSTQNAYQPVPNNIIPQSISQNHSNTLQSENDKRQIRVQQQGKNHQVAVNIGQRYDEYLEKGKEEEYRYNIFSVMDEPWNRCINGEKCGHFPKNQCIAPQSYRKYWN